MSLIIPETAKKRVVVLGGGFAGITLVKKLDEKLFQTVLIDRNNYHQFQPLIYQVASLSEGFSTKRRISTSAWLKP